MILINYNNELKKMNQFSVNTWISSHMIKYILRFMNLISQHLSRHTRTAYKYHQ